MDEKLNEGIKIGEAKGIAKGKVETTIEVVKRMHLKGISNDIIAEVTNTSLEEIEKIINK